MAISTNVCGGNLDLLIDTHVLIWAFEGSPRLSTRVRDAMIDPTNRLFASAVTAWECADLKARERLPALADFAVVVDRLSLVLLEIPADLWTLAARLPNIHGDPMNRMLVAHAIHADLTLVTADATIRGYPLRTYW